MPTYTPQQYARRDSILQEITGQDRILLAHCAAEALTAGKPLTHAINRLVDSGHLVRHERVLPGGLTTYTLSPLAASRLGLPRDRAELPTGAALDVAIAVQVFSHLGRHPRHRLSPSEVNELFDRAAPPNVPFVISDELGSPAVFRCVLAANRAPADTVRYVRTLVDQAGRQPQLAAWLSSRHLGFAILSPTAQLATAIEKALARSGLSERAAVIADIGPDADHLAAFLKTAKEKL